MTGCAGRVRNGCERWGYSIRWEVGVGDELREILATWADIAASLCVDERTCRRWESDHGLPIQRTPSGRVWAYVDGPGSLREWWTSTAVRVRASMTTGAPERGGETVA